MLLLFETCCLPAFILHVIPSKFLWVFWIPQPPLFSSPSLLLLSYPSNISCEELIYMNKWGVSECHYLIAWMIIAQSFCPTLDYKNRLAWLSLSFSNLLLSLYILLFSCLNPPSPTLLPQQWSSGDHLSQDSVGGHQNRVRLQWPHQVSNKLC